MDTQLRPTGIEGVGDRPWGTHFCLFYENNEDLLDLLIPYFKAGLEANEFCLYVASEPVIAEEAERALRGAVPSFKQFLASGQIEIISHRDWYLATGRFDPLLARQSWIDKLDRALAHGYAGMRFLASALWLERQDWETFSEYEGKLDEVFCQLRLMAVCAYALEHCSAMDMLDVVQHHQFTVARRHRAWQRLEGPELNLAYAEIRKLNANLERQVEARTAQLAGINEQLKDEITQRRRSAEALRASEARLQAAIEAADIGLWDYDLVSGQVTWLGHQLELFGFAPGEFDGTDRGLAKHVHPDDAEELNRVARRARDTGLAFAHEYRVIWHDGSIHWIGARGRFVHNERGQPIRMYGALRDVTERKKSEEALRRSDDHLRLVVDAIPALVWSAQPDGSVDFINQRHQEFTGLSLSDVQGWRWTALIHPEDRTQIVGQWRRALAAGEALEVEARLRRARGDYRWLLMRSMPLRDESGGIVRWYGTKTDIEDWKQAESALRQSESELAEAQRVAHLGNWSLEIASNTMRWSAELYRIFDVATAALDELFESFVSRIHPDDRSRVLELNAAARASGQAFELEYRILTGGGQLKHIREIGYAKQDSTGVVSGLFGIAQDITERKLAEEETRRQAARAETLARIAARLNKNLELEAVIHAVCEEAINTFQVSQASISLYDKKRDLLVYAGGVNIPPAYSATMEPITRTRFEELVRALGSIMVVADIQAVPDVPNVAFSSQLDVRTVATVAMRRDQELVGALAIGVNGRVREFAQDELALLKAVCDQAAQAIANAQLLKAANEQQDQLRVLSAKLAEAQEAERRAVARELHDEIGQLLYAVGANLEAIRIAQAATTQAARLAESAALVDEALRQIRDLALELRPSMLDDFGLVPALNWFVERQAQRSGFQASFTADPPDLRLSSGLETAVFRIVQIALTNVARHAQARQVTITVSRQEAELLLLILDDGVGFDVAAALERARRGATLGLPSMQERARLAGGTLEINSAPGQGTTIRAHFPIDQPGPP